MVQIFDFSNNLDFSKFIESIEQIMNFRENVLYKLAFNIYDYD